MINEALLLQLKQTAPKIAVLSGLERSISLLIEEFRVLYANSTLKLKLNKQILDRISSSTNAKRI